MLTIKKQPRLENRLNKQPSLQTYNNYTPKKPKKNMFILTKWSEYTANEFNGIEYYINFGVNNLNFKLVPGKIYTMIKHPAY